MKKYMTSDNDRLDLVCFRHYGFCSPRVEAVLEANPGLAKLGPVYEAGTVINLPDIAAGKVRKISEVW